MRGPLLAHNHYRVTVHARGKANAPAEQIADYEEGARTVVDAVRNAAGRYPDYGRIVAVNTVNRYDRRTLTWRTALPR